MQAGGPLTANNHLSIELNHISKSYTEGESRKTVIDNLSLRVRKGEKVVLLGRSGSGKSTLLNLMSGIDLPDSGEIIINNRDTARLSEKERTLLRREAIGFVFQFFNLIPTLTVYENLLLPLQLNADTQTPSEHNEQIMYYLSELSLADRANTFTDKLSGGEQQRIAIARALIHNPEIILADEPTGNLDEDNAAHVIEIFSNLIQKQNKTLIMVTHDRTLTSLADHTYELTDKSLRQM